jgi:hypothetical protein
MLKTQEELDREDEEISEQIYHRIKQEQIERGY